MAVDVGRLEQGLREVVRGEVRFSDGDRALYATDASNYRRLPIGVVLPLDGADLIRTVARCSDAGVPVVPRGGGTSLAGQACNAGVVIDCSKYLNRILDLNPDARTARVQPGVVLDHLRSAAGPHGLTFGPDPSTHNRCTLGGMLGNNSCGVHSMMAGRTEDNVRELDVLTPDLLHLRVGPTPADELARLSSAGGRVGEIYTGLATIRDRHERRIREGFPGIPRRVSGYNLPSLLPERGFDVARALVGTEGTCVTILEATVALVPDPPSRSLLVVGFPDVFAAADAVPAMMEHGPIGLEGIDEVLVEDMRRNGLHVQELDLLPEGGGWLLVEFGGDTKEEADERAGAALRDLDGEPGVHAERYDDPDREQRIWEVRESGLGATARVPGRGDAWPGWEDSAVGPDRLGDYLRDLRGLYDRFGYHAATYGHFGQGCVHTRIDFDLVTAEGVATYRSFVEAAADLCVSYGGSLSGEHGDGQSRGELLGRMFGSDLVRAFGEFKSLWDPEGLMNPGKVVDPRPLDADLRLGASFAPAAVRTAFRYPDDDGSFARATQRCVGVGACRRSDGGVMCPSYMVTHEEKDSTRGRAHLLFEMLQGDPLEGGWREDAVLGALDLCLSCKGCKSDCPVNVDMATYKAEFLHHHYRGRARPRSAYSLGLIPWTARAAALAPGFANALTHGALTGPLVKRLGGVAQSRDIPAFASSSFRSQFRRHRSRRGSRGPVILWPDTFNDRFHPEVAWSAVRVLESAGFAVSIPSRWLCCGRPLYDFGMLDLARRALRRILTSLRDPIRRGVPVVGLEPSCVAVFRDELVGLFPDDLDARRLSSQTLTLAELLDRTDGWTPPRIEGEAMVQPHCHHRSVMGFDTDEEIMRRTGLSVRVLDAGCCGMAGAFGFEATHVAVSNAAGERALLPAVRAAGPDTLFVADGFSCREQIVQGTGRRVRHLAEILGAAGPRDTARDTHGDGGGTR